MGRTAAADGLDRGTMVVAGVVTVGLLMAVLDTTIVNVALETLSRDLRVGLGTIQWVSTSYLLSLASVIPLSGWVTERFGSNPAWIASIALFGIGSGLCALATSAGELIAFRVLQGIGGGMLLPVGLTLIAQRAGPQRIGRALAIIGVPVLLAPVFGPVIGGLIVDDAARQWLFVVNLPIAAVAIGVAVVALGRDAGRGDAGRLDVVGVALLCPGVVGVIFGLSEIATRGGVGHPGVFGPVAAGLVLIGLFAWHAVRVERPLIDVRLLRSPGFRAAAVATLLLAAALFGMLLVLPLYFQLDRGRSALDAGLLLAPQGIGAAVMLPCSGRLTDRFSGGPLVAVGACVVALATVPWLFVTDHTPYTLLIAALFVRGLGFGASIQPTTAAAYAALDSSQVPRATAALNTLRQIGASVGTALLAVVLQHQSSATLSAATGHATAMFGRVTAGERARIAGPLAHAFAHTFAWAPAIAVVAILPAVALLRAERRSRPGGATVERIDPRREPDARRAA